MPDPSQIARSSLYEIRLAGEALASLGAASRMRSMLPFPVLVRAVGTPTLETPHTALSAVELHTAEQILNMIRRIGRLLPGFRNCLVQALAAKLMLRRRGIPSTLYFSVATSESGGIQRIAGHAWLRCGPLTFRRHGPFWVDMLAVGDRHS